MSLARRLRARHAPLCPVLRLHELYGIRTVPFSKRCGIDFFKGDLHRAAPCFHSWCFGSLAWNSGITCLAKSSRLSQMCSCVFLPAWFSKMIWSTCEVSNLRAYCESSPASRSAPPTPPWRALRDSLLPFLVLLLQTYHAWRWAQAILPNAVCPVIPQRELEKRNTIGPSPRLLVRLGAHKIAHERHVRVGIENPEFHACSSVSVARASDRSEPLALYTDGAGIKTASRLVAGSGVRDAHARSSPDSPCDSGRKSVPSGVPDARARNINPWEGPRSPWVIADLRAANSVARPLLIRLRQGNQPAIIARNRF